MKNQKGITLIALIITIIVMLILVGVSVSTALNTGLFKSAQGAAKNTEAEKIKEEALSNGTINIKGQEGEIDINDYVASLKGEDGGSAKWELTTDVDENGEISIGDLVTHKEKTTEQFYVISVTGDTVAMLAAKNITTTEPLQQSDSPTVAFCSETAWNGASVAEGDNLNDKQSIKSDATSAVALAKAYGQSLGVETGRLMLYSEAEALETANSKILYGQYEEGSYLNYWLGSAGGTRSVWTVYGDGSYLGNNDFDDVHSFVVRPVVEISKSGI